jgi:hypothetical protein
VSAHRRALSLLRGAAMLALVFGVLALHSLDLGHSAPASLAGAAAAAEPTSMDRASAGHSGGPSSDAASTPAHEHGQGEPGRDAHHGWIGVCLAILGTVFVLAAAVLLGTRWWRTTPADIVRLCVPGVLATSLPPPRPSIHVLCVMRT